MRKRKFTLSLFAVVLLFSLLIFDACIPHGPSPPEALKYDPDDVMAFYVESTHDTNLLAYTHAQEGVTCLDCHDITILRQLYEQFDPEANTLEEERMLDMSKEFCFVCHGTYADIIKLLEDRDIEEYEGINPHIHLNEEWEGQRNCSSCHKNHSESQPDINYCYNCHHMQVLVNCSECHGE